ncbi:hypothetical protein F751_1135 [Auxenochlorella protothecoides]|uniref:Uncharacterized protein n=1 Tax=Auxenochlorella protothecoides TaxID=3075 RepID=A0A087SMP5_AUXPR|nr:hypothetical protein F751_1135 [Auxenochlorella protothecoides]KFM26999.1 hypothetical protein F751_1135 [Auxenochlorella protothecoides]
MPPAASIARRPLDRSQVKAPGCPGCSAVVEHRCCCPQGVGQWYCPVLQCQAPWIL